MRATLAGWRPRRLSTKLTIPFIAVLVSALTVLWLVSSGSTRTAMTQSIDERAEVFVDILAASLADPLSLGEVERLQQLLDKAKQSDPDVAYAILVDAKGTAVASTDPSLKGQVLRRTDFEKAMVESSALTRRPVPGSRSVFEMAMPVKYQALGKLGTLRIGFTTARIQRTVRNTEYLVLVVGLTALLLGTGLYVYVARVTAKPLRETVASLEELARGEGDLTRRIEVGTDDEVGALGRAFNAFLDRFNAIIAVATRISRGDFSVTVSPESERDELGHAFSRMVGELSNVAQVAGRISEGDLTIDVVPRSEQDLLRQALHRMVEQLRSFHEGLERKVSEATRDLDRRRVEAEELARIVGLLTESLDVSVVGQRIAESVLKFLAVDASTLWLLQPDGSMLAAAAAGTARDRYPAGKAVMPPGTGMPGRAVREGGPVWSADVLHDNISYSEEIRSLFLTKGSVAALGVPFRMQGRIMGALVVSDRVGRKFSDGEVSLLQTYASSAGLALEQARLHEETERRRREAEELGAVARTLTESLDVKAVAARIVEGVRRLLDVAGATVYQLQNGQSLLALAVSDDSGFRKAGSILPVGTGVAGQAVVKGEPVFSTDILHDPRIVLAELHEQLAPLGDRSVLAVPLRSKGQIVGALSVSAQAGRRFPEANIALLETFGDQAALALENARLFEETVRRRREAEELARVAQSLTESLDMAAVGERILTSVSELFGVKAAMLRLLQPDGSFRTLASSGESFSLHSGGDTLPPGRGLTGLAVAEGKPIWSADVLNEPNIPLTDEMRDHQLRSGNRSMIAVPLRAHDAIIGTLALSDRTGRVYADGEVALLQTFADQAALALENARLFEETHRRNLELQAVFTVTNTITQSLDIKALTQAALLTTIEVLGVDAGRLYVLDEAEGVLRLTAHHGLPADELGDYECYAPGVGIVGRIFSQNQPVVFADVSSDPNYAAMARSGRGKAWGFRSAAGLPITVKGRPVGVIYVNGRAVREFTQQDLKLLSVIGEQIGVALENARLFEETERRRREAEELGLVSRTLAESLDVSAVGQRIAESVLPLFAAQDAVVWLAQPDSSMVVLASTSPAGNPLTRGYVLPPGMGLPARTVAEGRPIWSSDVLSQDDVLLPDDLRRHIADSGTAAVLAVPLRAKGKTIGALVIRGRTGRAFSKDEVGLLETFAAQGALALENARLFEAERTRQEQLSAVRKIGQEVSTELELEPLLHLIIRRAVELAGRSSGIVYTLEDEVLVPRAWWNLGPWLAEVRFRLGQGIPGIVAQSGQAMIVNDYLNSPYMNPLFKEHSKVTALIAMPLISKGRVVGVITINNTQTTRPFTEADEAILALLAPQAAAAIDNAGLFRETERRRREAEELAQAARALTESLEVEAVATRIVDGVRRLLTVAHAAVFQVRADGSLVAVATGSANGEGPKAGYRLPPGAGIAGRAVAQGAPVYCADITKEREFRKAEVYQQLAASGIRALLAIPLRSKGQIVGALGVGDVAGRIYTAADIALLQTFGDQAALALENAGLFEETRRLVGELGATTTELSVKNKELDTFVYTVSHDLKAPLVTLQGMADLLVESCGKDLDEQGQHYVTRIRANAQQMEQLVLDLLALSRIGREGRAPEAVELDEVVDELLMEWEERIRLKGVTVTRHDLPRLWGVRTHIEQVVTNLVSNAIKYLGETPAPTVEVGAKDSGGEPGDGGRAMVECYVKDNGIGIDPAYHEKVFEIFQRLKETEAEGTGVGLAIVKKIVEGAGGRIWVESAKGQGSTFRFTWPRAEVPA